MIPFFCSMVSFVVMISNNCCFMSNYESSWSESWFADLALLFDFC